MSRHVHTDYYEDILEKRYCKTCQKTFIVGEELSKTVPTIHCPYCCSTDNEGVTWCNDDLLDELGCMGINFHKTDNKYYDRCILCDTPLTKDTVEHQSLCKACKSATNGG